jgi:phage terminase small subunit
MHGWKKRPNPLGRKKSKPPRHPVQKVNPHIILPNSASREAQQVCFQLRKAIKAQRPVTVADLEALRLYGALYDRWHVAQAALRSGNIAGRDTTRPLSTMQDTEAKMIRILAGLGLLQKHRPDGRHART